MDMGQIDEEDQPYMIVDKDTGRMYDMRNDNHLGRLTDTATTRFGTQYAKQSDGQELQSSEATVETSASKKTNRKSTGGSSWADWWKEKKKNG